MTARRDAFTAVSGVAFAVAACLLGGPAQGAAASKPLLSNADVSVAEQPLTAEERLKRNRVSADTESGDAEFRGEQNRGLAGDGDAALRVALMYKRGSNGVPR